MLYHSVDDDVYGTRVIQASYGESEVRCPLPELVRHELERIQSQFVVEWFFFDNDPAAGLELLEYGERKIPVLALNIKSKN